MPPKKEFDQALFERLCSIQCTKEEVSAVMDMDMSTLSVKCKDVYGCSYSDAIIKYRLQGNASLRREQMRWASKGNGRMLEFLGINYLNQTNKIDYTSNGKTVGQINIVVKDAATEKALTNVLNEVGGRNQNNGDVPQATPGD